MAMEASLDQAQSQPTNPAQPQGVLMVAPGGSESAYVPYEQVQGYLDKGAEPGIRMTAPDGKQKAIVPYSQQNSYQQKGATWDDTADNQLFKKQFIIGSDGKPYLNKDDYLSETEKGLGEAANDIGGTIKNIVTHPIDTVKNIVKSTFVPLQVYDSVKEEVPIINAYENARSQGKSILESLSAANDQAKKQNVAQQKLQEAVDNWKANPTQESVRYLADAGAAAASMYAGGEIFAPAEEGAEAEAAAGAGEEAAEAAPKPGIVKQVVQGEKVAQAPAKAAVKTGVESAGGEAGEGELLQGNRTVMDDHLDNLSKQEDAAYKKYDDAAGVDRKALQERLDKTQEAQSELTGTPADVKKMARLKTAEEGLKHTIADADAKAEAAGVDIKEADALHQKRMAGEDFKKVLVKNTNADGSVNVDGLLNDAKNMRFQKLGRNAVARDRLADYFGKDGSDKLVNELVDAQKMGTHALKMQKIAKILALPTLGTVGTVAYEASK